MKTTNLFSLLEYFPMSFDEFEKALFDANMGKNCSRRENLREFFCAKRLVLRNARHDHF